MTPSGPLTAKRRRLMAVEGPNAEIAGATVLTLPLLPRIHGGNPGAPLHGSSAPSRRGRAAGGTLSQRLGWIPVGTLGI